MATFGVSVVSARKLRPLFGSALMLLAPSDAATVVRDGSTRTSCVALIVTACSSVAARSSLNDSATIDPTVTEMPFCSTGRWPTARTFTSYVPSGSRGATKTPASLDCTTRVTLVATLRRVAVAPTTTAPEASATVPRMTPVVAADCAARQPGRARATAARKGPNRFTTEKRSMRIPWERRRYDRADQGNAVAPEQRCRISRGRLGGATAKSRSCAPGARTGFREFAQALP